MQAASASGIHPPLQTTTHLFRRIRMGGRVVYRTALEMRSTATYREFESHPIRHVRFRDVHPVRQKQQGQAAL